MTVIQHIRGHLVDYDDEKKCWRYKDTGKRVFPDDGNIKCTRCQKTPVHDADFCLQGLRSSDFITAACCGHGVFPGYIKLADGRVFREAEK